PGTTTSKAARPPRELSPVTRKRTSSDPRRMVSSAGSTCRSTFGNCFTSDVLQDLRNCTICISRGKETVPISVKRLYLHVTPPSQTNSWYRRSAVHRRPAALGAPGSSLSPAQGFGGPRPRRYQPGILWLVPVSADRRHAADRSRQAPRNVQTGPEPSPGAA